MEALINELKEKAGLTEEQALKSIEVIKNFITTQLPPMMQPMVENFLGKQSTDNSDDAIGG